MNAHTRVAAVEDALVRLLFDEHERRRFLARETDGPNTQLDRDLRTPHRANLDALSEEVTKRLVNRPHRGVGTLATAFPEVFDAWVNHHSDDPEGTALVSRFSASGAACGWRPIPHVKPGWPLEYAFAQFVLPLGLVPTPIIERRMLLAIGRALTVDPNPCFRVPPAFTGRPGHWIAVQAGPAPFLIAAIRGQLISGPITPLVASLIQGQTNAEAQVEFGLDFDAVQQTRTAVQSRGLIAA